MRFLIQLAKIEQNAHQSKFIVVKIDSKNLFHLFSVLF